MKNNNFRKQLKQFIFPESSEGFTLLEILIAISIIGILSVFGMTAYTNSLNTGRDARRRADLEQIKSALEMFRSDSINSRYPLNTEGLDILETGNPRYLNVPLDPRDGLNYAYYASNNGSDYALGTNLEGTSPGCDPVIDGIHINGSFSFICGDYNGGTAPCDYCIGPYGRE